MATMNRIFLMGNLTKDPELRYTPSGTPVASLRLAVNSTFKGQDGQRKEDVCYVTIVVWNKQAELCNQYLKKGRPILVEGRLIYRSWEQEGKTRSTLEVRADRVQFMGRREDAGPSHESSEEPVPVMDEPTGGGSPDAPDEEPPF